MQAAQTSKVRTSALFEGDQGATFDVSELVNSIAKDEDDLVALSKAGEDDPLQFMDLTDNQTTLDGEKQMHFKSLQLKAASRGLMITPGAALPPSKFVLDTAYLYDLAEKHREKIQSEIEKIDVAFYAKHLRRVKLQKELAKFETRAKNIIYLGLTKLAYIGVMTYAGPIAISFFLNHMCALTAPLGAANAALNAAASKLASIEQLKRDNTDPSKVNELEKLFNVANKEKADASAIVTQRQSDLDNSMTTIITKFVMEALFGMNPTQMQNVEKLLHQIQSQASRIFSDPGSNNLDTNGLLQTAFGKMNLFGFTDSGTKSGANEHIGMEDFRISVLELKNALITAAAGPFATFLTTSPKELMKIKGLLHTDDSTVKLIEQAQSFVDLPALDYLKYGVELKAILNNVTKAKSIVMGVYRDYTYEINNVVGIFTGTNKELDDPDYITKHFNGVVKRPFNSMALRNGIVGKIENYIFGKDGGKTFNVFASSSGDDKDSEKGTHASANDAAKPQPVPAGERSRNISAQMYQEVMTGIPTPQYTPVSATPPKTEEPIATHKEGLWAFFDVGAASSFFKVGYDIPGKLYESVKDYTINRLTPRACIGTAAGAFYDSITHSIYTQVEGFMPEEKGKDPEEASERYEQEMKEYEEGLAAQRLNLIKQGKSGDALVNMMRETAIISNPSYVMNAQDHSALEYAWISVQKKAKELQKRGVLSELFLLWGAGGTAQLFGMMATYASKPPQDQPLTSLRAIDWYTLGPNTFVDVFASYKIANAELATSSLANELKDSFNKLHNEIYDEYIRKPALNSELGVWLQKNIKNKSKDLVNKVMGRIYLSTYINQIWNKIVDIVFDTLINLPLNIPNSIITNMQHDFTQKFAIYDYMNPQGWRFIMDNLTMSNIQNVYSRISWGLRHSFSFTKSATTALLGESLASHIALKTGNEVRREGFQDMEGVLGHERYQLLVGLSDTSIKDVESYTQRLNESRKTGKVFDELNTIEKELATLSDTADSNKKARLTCLLHWLKGQRLKEEALQNKLNVNEYISTKYRLKSGEKREELLSYTKLDRSSLASFFTQSLAKTLYSYLKPLIGERSYAAYYLIPIGGGQHIKLTDPAQRNTYRLKTDRASLVAQMALQASVGDRTVDEEFLKDIAQAHKLSYTDNPTETSAIIKEVEKLVALIKRKNLSDAEIASFVKGKFDRSLEKINNDVFKANVPPVTDITSLPFLYFRIGNKTFRYQKYDKSNLANLIQPYQAQITKIETDMAILDPKSEQYAYLKDKRDKLKTIIDVLNKGPRTPWEAAFNLLAVEVPDGDNYLTAAEIEKVKHKPGFSYFGSVPTFTNISDPSTLITNTLLGTAVSEGVMPDEKIIIRRELYGICGNVIQEEVISAVQLQQQALAASYVMSMIGSEGFELLDNTSEGSKLYKLLISQVYNNPAFMINLASYASLTFSSEELTKQLNDNIEKLKKSDPKRYEKIKKQLEDIENGISGYLDNEFVSLYNAIKQAEKDKEDARTAALAALPEDVQRMLGTNKTKVLDKHTKETDKQLAKLKELRQKLAELSACTPLNDSQKLDISEIQRMHAAIGVSLHPNSVNFIENKSTNSITEMNGGMNTIMSATNVMNGGCVSKEDLDAMKTQVDNFENLINDIQGELIGARYSSGLNIGILLKKVHSMMFDSEQLDVALKNLTNKNTTYKSHLDNIKNSLETMRKLYIKHLLAKAIEQSGNNDTAIEEGEDLFDASKNGLDSTVRSESAGKIQEQIQMFSSFSFDIQTLSRPPKMTNEKYIVYLESHLRTLNANSTKIAARKTSASIVLASLQGGVLAVKAVTAIEPKSKLQFSSDAQKYNERLKEAEKNNTVFDTLNSIEVEWLQKKNESSDPSVKAKCDKVINWVHKRKADIGKGPLSLTDVDPELDRLFDNFSIDPKLMPFISKEFTDSRSSLDMQIIEYNKNINRIHVIRTLLNDKMSSVADDYTMTEEDKKIFNELTYLLNKSALEYGTLQALIKNYENTKKTEIANAKQLYINSIKKQAYTLTHKPNKDGKKVFAYGIKALQKEKRELLDLLTQLTIIGDKENIDIVKMKMKAIDEIIANREVIESLQKRLSLVTDSDASLNNYITSLNTLLETKYDASLENYIITLNALIEKDKALTTKFTTKYGNTDARKQAIKDAKLKINTIYKTELDLYASLSKAAYDTQANKRIERALGLLSRYSTQYGTGPDYTNVPEPIKSHMRYLSDVVNGFIPLIPTLTLPLDSNGVELPPTIQIVMEMNSRLYNFIRNSNALATADDRLNQADAAIKDIEDKERDLQNIKNVELQTNMRKLSTTIGKQAVRAIALKARLESTLTSNNPKIKGPRDAAIKILESHTALQSKLDALMKKHTYDPSIIASELAELEQQVNDFDTTVTEIETAFDTTWHPAQTKETVDTTFTDTITALELTNASATDKLSALRAKYDHYKNISKYVHMISLTTLIDNIEMQIKSLDDIIEERKTNIERWKNEKTTAENQGVDQLSTFLTKFLSEQPTEDLSTILEVASKTMTAQFTESKVYTKLYIKALRAEAATVKETLKIINELKKTRNNAKEQGFITKIWRTDKLGKNTQEILDNYERVLTDKNTTKYVGKTRYEVLQLQDAAYSAILGNRSDDELEVYFANLDDQTSPDIQNVLEGNGNVAERERVLSDGEVRDYLTYLNYEIDHFEKVMADHVKNRKTPIPQKERGDKESEENTTYYDIKDTLATFTALKTGLTNMYRLNPVTNAYELNEDVAITDKLTEEQLNIIKTQVQQARRAKNTEMGKVDIYRFVFQNVRKDAEQFARIHGKPKVDGEIDRYDLNFLLHNYTDPRNAAVEAAKITGMALGGGVIATGAMIGAAKATALGMKKMFGTKTADPIGDKFVQDLQAFGNAVQEKTQYIVNRTGVVIGSITAAGQKVWKAGVAAAEGTYKVMKPVIDAATKFMVDGTGAIIGFVSKTGEKIWTAGAAVANRVYSTIEPAIDKVGEIIGWTFDKLNGAANVVINKAGEFIGYMSDQLGMLITEAGEMLGSAATYVRNSAGNVIGKIADVYNEGGKLIRTVVNSAGSVAAYLVGDEIVTAITEVVNWSANRSREIYQQLKSKAKEAWEPVKDTVYYYYKASGAESVVEAVKVVANFAYETYGNLKTAYQETIPISRLQAQRAFRIEYIIDNFMEKNTQILKDSNISLNELRSHLRNCLQMNAQCQPMSESLISNELYNKIVTAEIYAEMLKENTDKSATDYSVTVFLDAIFNGENTLALNYTGTENQDIGSRIDEFINNQKIKNASSWESFAYRSLETAEYLVNAIRIGLGGLGAYGLKTLGYKIIPSLVAKAGTVGLGTGSVYGTAMSGLVGFMQVASIGMIAAIGAKWGYKFGKGLSYVLEAAHIIEGTDTQKSVISTGSAIFGGVFAGAVGYIGVSGGITAITGTVLLTSAAIAASTVLLVGIFALAASSYILEGAITAGEKALLSSLRRNGETDEQAIARIRKTSQRAMVNLANFTSKAIFQDSNGFVIFEKSANKLTTLLNANKDVLLGKHPAFEKLFKDGKTLGDKWYENTASYDLNEAEVQSIINEVMKLDKSLVESLAKKQAGGGDDPLADFYNQVQGMLDTVYFNIFLSNFSLFTYGASSAVVSYACANQFAIILEQILSYSEKVFSGEELFTQNIVILVPATWSNEPVTFTENNFINLDIPRTNGTLEGGRRVHMRKKTLKRRR